MKAVQLLKKEIMDSNPYNYALWIVCVGLGCFAYLNTPYFLDFDLAGFVSELKKVISLAWALVVVFLTGVVAVLANKVAARIWEDRGKVLYEKLFGRNRKNKKH